MLHIHSIRNNILFFSQFTWNQSYELSFCRVINSSNPSCGGDFPANFPTTLFFMQISFRQPSFLLQWRRSEGSDGSVKSFFFEPSLSDLPSPTDILFSVGSSPVDLLCRTLFRRIFSDRPSPADLLFFVRPSPADLFFSVGSSPMDLLCRTFSDGPSPLRRIFSSGPFPSDRPSLADLLFSSRPSPSDLLRWTSAADLLFAGGPSLLRWTFSDGPSLLWIRSHQLHRETPRKLLTMPYCRRHRIGLSTFL